MLSFSQSRAGAVCVMNPITQPLGLRDHESMYVLIIDIIVS